MIGVHSTTKSGFVNLPRSFHIIYCTCDRATLHHLPKYQLWRYNPKHNFCKPNGLAE